LELEAKERFKGIEEKIAKAKKDMGRIHLKYRKNLLQVENDQLGIGIEIRHI